MNFVVSSLPFYQLFENKDSRVVFNHVPFIFEKKNVQKYCTAHYVISDSGRLVNPLEHHHKGREHKNVDNDCIRAVTNHVGKLTIDIL